MKKNNKKNKKADSLLIILILITIAVICITSYYLIFTSRTYFHSDCTDTILWAEASYDAGSIFNKDFNYACLLPFGGHLLMLPFIGIFGLSMTTHLIGMFLFFLLFVFSIIFMLRSAEWDLKWICITVSVMISTLSLSEKLREIFWGHIIYYSLGIFFLFIGVGLINNYIKNKGKKEKIFGCLTAVWIFLCSLNGLQALTIFGLPALMGYMGRAFFDRDFEYKRDKKQVIVCIIIIVSIIIGYAVGKWLAGDIKGGYADAYSTFDDYSKWVENAEKLFTSWTRLLGVDIKGGESLMEINSIMNMIKFVSSFVIIIIPFIMTLLYNKTEDKFTRLMIFIHWFIVLFIMIGFILGKLSAGNWRLSPILCTAVILNVCFWKHTFEKCEVKRFAAAAPIFIVMSCGIAQYDIINMEYGEWENTQLYRISNFLEEKELKNGYATFWNANAVTVISGDKVRVTDVVIDNGFFEKRPYQNNNKWYDFEGECFVLLKKNEYYDMMDKNPNIINMAENTMKSGDFIILVYDENIIKE